MYLLPSIANVTLIVNSSTCANQSSKCALTKTGVPPLWYETTADEEANDNKTVGPNLPPTDWDSRYAALLNMTGDGQFFSERLTLYDDGNYKYDGTGDQLNYHVMSMSNSYSAQFPGGAGYTISSGFVGLPMSGTVVQRCSVISKQTIRRYTVVARF
jgi:hypothetical protein